MAVFRRKQYFIQREMQLRFAKFVILFALGAALITGLTVFYTTFFMLGERLADVYPQGRLITIFRNAHIALLINLLLILPPIFWVSIRFSHRVAGPLPKIYQAIKDVRDGNYNVNLVLRKKDELRELADLINEMSKSLKEKGTTK
jgi:signal transduction histidine kinase